MRRRQKTSRLTYAKLNTVYECVTNISSCLHLDLTAVIEGDSGVFVSQLKTAVKEKENRAYDKILNQLNSQAKLSNKIITEVIEEEEEKEEEVATDKYTVLSGDGRETFLNIRF